MVRSRNADAPICGDIFAFFTNIDHLLECQNRHFFKPELIPAEPKFDAKKQYLVEILYAVSPIWFEARVHKCRDLNGNWYDWNDAERFDEFNEKLKQHYTKSFAPVEKPNDIDKTRLYVLRKGNKFMRCIILDTK